MVEVEPIDGGREERRRTLTEEEHAILEEYVAEYQEQAEQFLEETEQEDLAFNEFTDRLSDVTNPPLDLYSDTYEHGRVIRKEFKCKVRRFVYTDLVEDEWRGDLLEWWWGWDHFELLGPPEVSGYGVRLPQGPESVVKAQKVINAYDDFDFSSYR